MKKLIGVGFCLGIILGTVMANVFQVKQCLESSKIVEVISLQNIAKDELLGYVAKRRLFEFVVLGMSMFVPRTEEIFVGVMSVLGVRVAFGMSLWIKSFGLKGIYMFGGSVFPQVFFYGMGIFLVYKIAFARKRLKNNYRMLGVVAVGLLLCVGVWLESYVNVYFMKKVVDLL